MDWDVFVAITVIGVIYLLVSGANAMSGAIVAAWFSLDVTLKLTPVSIGTSFVNSSSHLFVYLRFSSTFRQSFLRLAQVILRKQTVVILLT